MKRFLFLLFCTLLPLLKADTSLHFVNGHLGLLNEVEGYTYSYPQKCTDILDAFADSASNFTKCSIKFARPVRICERCVEYYVQFDGKYQELLTTVVNGTSCRSIFLSHDRMDAVLEYHDNIQAIWDKGNCKGCFDWTNSTPTVSNSTVRFKKIYNNTMDCIIDAYDPNKNNSEEVCEKCMQSYLELDNYYKTLSTDGVGVDSICFDIVDSMNLTRLVWSKDLSCCKLRRSPEIVFLCCSGILSLLPILYYLAVRFCGPIRDLPNVLKQSRFKQSFEVRRPRREIN